MAPPRGSVGTRSECEMANRFFRSRRTTGARRTSFISLFSLPTRSSVCEGDDQVVADRFDSVDVQRKFRGKILRLARLEIPRAVAVLAYDGDPLPVHVAVRQHGPLVRARLVHAIEVVAESHDHDVIPHDLEVRQGTIRDLLHLAQGDVLLHRRGEPGECLKDLRLTRLFDAEGKRANFSRRGRALPRAGGRTPPARQSHPRHGCTPSIRPEGSRPRPPARARRDASRSLSLPAGARPSRPQGVQPSRPRSGYDGAPAGLCTWRRAESRRRNRSG